MPLVQSSSAVFGGPARAIFIGRPRTGAPSSHPIYLSANEPASDAGLSPYLIEQAKKFAGKKIGGAITYQDSMIAAGAIAGAGAATELLARYWPAGVPPTALVAPLPPVAQVSLSGQPPGLAVTTPPLTPAQVRASTQMRVGNVQGPVPDSLTRNAQEGRVNTGSFARGPRSAVPVGITIPTGTPVTIPTASPVFNVPRPGPGVIEGTGTLIRSNAYLITLGEARTQDELLGKLGFALATGGPGKAGVALFVQFSYKIQHDLGLLPGPYLQDDPSNIPLRQHGVRDVFSPVTDP